MAELPPDPGGWTTDLLSLLFSFGPHLLTWDEVGKLGALEVATLLNGEVRRRNTGLQHDLLALPARLFPCEGDEVAP